MQFSIGDRVVCVEEWERGFNGEEGIVTGFWQSDLSPERYVVQVKFDNHPEVKEWYSHRFAPADPTLAALSPVCRKIRSMEKRWLTFQQKKSQQAALEHRRQVSYEKAW